MKTLLVILLSVQQLPYQSYIAPGTIETNPKIMHQLDQYELYIGDELELKNVNEDNIHLIDDIMYL